jgi:hypothetical protein
MFLLAPGKRNRNNAVLPKPMNYNELIQLYFERANAMQAYWNLYVIIVGGLLAFSSMRKQPAAVTTALVSILFALFAYKNLDAMHDVTTQRFATLQAIKQFDSSGTAPANSKQVRDLLEPTLTPATYGSVRATHVTSDILTIGALLAMEFRRRKLRRAMTAS